MMTENIINYFPGREIGVEDDNGECKYKKITMIYVYKTECVSLCCVLKNQ